MNTQIQKQLDFVEWLKSKRLYNTMESSSTMVKLQEVYDELQKESNRKDVLLKACYDILKKCNDVHQLLKLAEELNLPELT